MVRKETITGIAVTISAILFILLFVILFMLLLGGEGENQHKIHFDNGFDNRFNIFVDNISVGSIEPKSFEIINITSGVHKIDVIKDNGELFESNNITLDAWQPGSQRYIYNIGRKFFYYTEICKYGDDTGKKDISGDDLGNETLIKYTFAYDFGKDCPDKIYVTKGTKYAIEKKISKRIDK